MTYNIEQTLQQYFGYNSFRHNQEEIIQNVLAKKDSIVLMPTGGGKSLCYQIPALLMDGITIVVSPLIALMKDQVDALKLNGVAAAFLNSSQSAYEQGLIAQQLKNNQLKLLYVAPERLLGANNLLNDLKNLNVALFAIDEAHCISHWGHDFRPEYLVLGQLKKQFPAVPIIALTATADALTRKDIIQKLEVVAYTVYENSFNRPNISYYVKPKRNYFDQLVDFLEDHKDDSGIIYCLSRASTEKLAADLREEGYAAAAYHAGLERNVKEKNQDEFLKDEIKIIVATIAFGMGIDKSNVRFVVHVDLPKNIEGYYQETGRAGRDGLPSEAILFYSAGDVFKLKSFAQVEGNAAQSKVMLKKLDQMSALCETRQCRRKYLLNYFDEPAPNFCGSCDVCLSEEEKVDATIEAQKFLSGVSRLQERFGVNYVIDFIRGSSTTRAEHQALKTFGIGKDLSKDQWKIYVKDMLQMGYLQQSDSEYPVLQLNELSRKILKGEMKVLLVKSVMENKKSTTTNDAEEPIHPELFKQLKAVRYALAKEENLPAFVIFSDATLVELATYLPLTNEHLSMISGFGAIKLAKYGGQFLDAIIEYCKTNNLTTKIDAKSRKGQRKSAAKPAERERSSDTKRQSLQLFQLGRSVNEIALERSLSASTIEGHLAHFIFLGELQIEKLVSKEKLKAISQAIEENGNTEPISPIKQKLGDQFSYGEIRAVISHLKRRSEA